jgi:hypothetical protein
MQGTRKFKVVEDLSIHTIWLHAKVEPGTFEKYLSGFNPFVLS